MRILVLGGTGLISTPTVTALLRDGHEVTVFNRGETPSRLGDDVEQVQGNRNDFDAFAAIAKEIAPDIVVDFLTFDSNTAVNSVEVFAPLDIKGYISCSAAAVYGRQHSIPATEDTPHHPMGEYARNKSEAEQVFMEALEQHGFPVTVLRPAQVYGPGQALPSLWGYDACLVSRIRTDKPVIVPGDGFGAFDLVYADDVADAIAGVVNTAGCIGRVYNVGPDEHTDWRRYLECVGAAVDKPVNMIPMPANIVIAGSPPDASVLLEELYQYPMAYDSSRLKGDVPGWAPKVSLAEGVRTTIAWLNANNAHMVPDEQPWVDGLIDKMLEFEKDLALSDFAFDEKLLGGD